LIVENAPLGGHFFQTGVRRRKHKLGQTKQFLLRDTLTPARRPRPRPAVPPRRGQPTTPAPRPAHHAAAASPPRRRPTLPPSPPARPRRNRSGIGQDGPPRGRRSTDVLCRPGGVRLLQLPPLYLPPSLLPPFRGHERLVVIMMTRLHSSLCFE